MAELVWSLNGKYFKDFGVGISSSDGMLGELKPKKQDTNDWSEYNGTALDLTKKPKYESREFTLSGWIVGADWLIMLNNFNALFGEFRNAGKQRLLLDVFGQKTLVFDVRCDDEIELKKTFRQGKMVGMFSLKLIEHNPIKKILYTANSNLQLAFNSPKWVEVNIDGNIESLKGSVNINRQLPVRFVSNYSFSGRNLLLNSGALKTALSFIEYNVNDILKPIIGENITISFDFKINNEGFLRDVVVYPYQSKGVSIKDIYFISTTTKDKWVRHSFTTSSFRHSASENGSIGFFDNGNNFSVKNVKIEKGNKATDWTPAPEDVHFISIAGNVEEITNLTTNAEVLWERL